MPVHLGGHAPIQVGSTLSSCEAEIMAASEATKEAIFSIFLNNFLDEIGLKHSQPVSLSSDNQGAIDLAYNPEHHQRTKHIERRHFFIREAVEDMRVRVPFVRQRRRLFYEIARF